MSSTKSEEGRIFRPARPDEYPVLLDIQYRAYLLKEVPLYGGDSPPLKETPETLAAEAKLGKRRMVAEFQGSVAGSLLAEVLPDGWVHICRVSVDTALMGRGIGQFMMREVEKLYPDAPGFVLDCGEKSVENFHIYGKLGYRKTGEGFQVPGGPFVWVMRKAGRDDMKVDAS